MYTSYAEWFNKVGRPRYGERLNTADLDHRFIPYMGQRVEVNYKPGWEDFTGYGARTNGLKARFTVGISTGQKPVFLMLLTKRSLDGAPVCAEAVESIRQIN